MSDIDLRTLYETTRANALAHLAKNMEPESALRASEEMKRKLARALLRVNPAVIDCEGLTLSAVREAAGGDDD